MENIKEIIIIGGGRSIKEGLTLNLKEKIKDKCVLTLNFAYNHFDSTATVFIDDQFYKGYITGCGITCDKEHVERLKKLPLIIGAYRNYLKFYPNTVPVRFTFSYFHNNPVKRGFYVGDKCLTGIFSLHIAAYLLDYNGSIYCLGFDGGVINASDTNSTHYYEDIKHKGINRTQIYTTEPLDLFFRKYLIEKELTIYNVSPNSNLNSFKKISYPEMFEQLTEEKYNQDELRAQIREKLTWNK
jgi:hypothetical protein